MLRRGRHLHDAGIQLVSVSCIAGRSQLMEHQRNSGAVTSMSTGKDKTIVSILDANDYWMRERRLTESQQRSRGRAGQPPMTDRLRSVAILVDQLERDGIRFGTARASKLNKAVRKWLNERMSNSTDKRKSRRKVIGADATTDLLKQVAELRKRQEH